MAIEFRCMQCARLLRVPDNTAGKPAQCPGCGAMMTIPGAAAGDSDYAIAPDTPAAGAPFGPPAGSQGRKTGTGPNVRPPATAGSRYAPYAPRPQPAGDPDNPYQSPMHYGEAPPLAGMRRAGTPAGRVIAPAIGLIAVAVLEIEALLCVAVGVLVGLAEQGVRGPRGMAPATPAFAEPAALLAISVLGIVLSVLVIVGAVKMKNLESRGFGMAAAVVVMLPLFMPGFLLGLPLGIWALVVLCDPQVKPLFGTGTPHVY
jgi:hypothetical protein